jgi:periplasmic protein TonB
MQPVQDAGVSGSAQTGDPPELEPELEPELDPEPEPDDEPDDDPEPLPDPLPELPLPELPLEEVPPLDEPLDPPLSLEPESLFLPSVEASLAPSKMLVAPLQ